MSTVFTKIIDGEFPGTFVWRDEHCVAFMSINPMAPGHVLVVPIAEIDHWIDAPSELASHLFSVTHTIGRAQRAAFGCDRVGVIVAGYEVTNRLSLALPGGDHYDRGFHPTATCGAFGRWQRRKSFLLIRWM